MIADDGQGRQSQGKTIEETLVNIREAMALGAQPHAILLGVVWKSIKIAAVGCLLVKRRASIR